MTTSAKEALAGIDYAMNWKNQTPDVQKFADGLATARQFVIDSQILLREAHGFVLCAANSAYNELHDPPPHPMATEADALSNRISRALAGSQSAGGSPT